MSAIPFILLAASNIVTGCYILVLHYRIKTLENLLSEPPLGVRGKCKGGPVKLKVVR